MVKKLKPRKKQFIAVFIAASILVFILVGLLIFVKLSNEKNTSTQAQKVITEVDSEYDMAKYEQEKLVYPIKNWSRYSNEEVGYSIEYPDNWTYQEESEDITALSQSYGSNYEKLRYINFFSPEKQYRLSIAVKRSDEETVSIDMYSGIPAGEFKKIGTIPVGNMKVEEIQLIYEGRIKRVFFPDAGTNFSQGKYIGNAFLSRGDVFADTLKTYS